MHQAFSHNIRQFYQKMQRSYYKMQQLLQNATFIANRDSTCGKCSVEIKLFIKQRWSKHNTEKSFLSHQAISKTSWKDQVWLKFQRGMKWVASRVLVFDGSINFSREAKKVTKTFFLFFLIFLMVRHYYTLKQIYKKI